MLVHTELVPQVLRNFIAEESRGDLNTLHIMQEFGSLAIFVGLLLIWQMRREKFDAFFHGSMTLFWGLLAIVHWFDVRGSLISVTGPLITTMPFVVFVLVGSIVHCAVAMAGGDTAARLQKSP